MRQLGTHEFAHLFANVVYSGMSHRLKFRLALFLLRLFFPALHCLFGNLKEDITQRQAERDRVQGVLGNGLADDPEERKSGGHERTVSGQVGSVSILFLVRIQDTPTHYRPTICCLSIFLFLRPENRVNSERLLFLNQVDQVVVTRTDRVKNYFTADLKYRLK